MFWFYAIIRPVTTKPVIDGTYQFVKHGKKVKVIMKTCPCYIPRIFIALKLKISLGMF